MNDPHYYCDNEAETRADLIDPKLRESGWGVVEGSRIRREYPITAGRVQTKGKGKPFSADYLLVYRGRPLAVVEAKKQGLSVAEEVRQAKEYADKLQIKATYSSNGEEIYQILLNTGEEKLIDRFPTPDELWDITYPPPNPWQDKFNAIPFYDISGTKKPRYYQEIAVNKVLDAIANDRTRLLLTLATGTGKTYIACQIVWKLFESRWNLEKTGKTRPKILFLTDRNTLANQAFSEFVKSGMFEEKALTRIKPEEIRKKGKAITGGSFLTPFKVRQIETSLDEYVYSPDDDVIEGEIDPNKVYTESDFNTNIEIRERELKRVQIFLSEINLNEKTLVFCATQEHAALIRDLINQEVRPSNPSYCVRVTANDGKRGETDLETFQDNDKTIPTILTTSRKLSTGVDARNVRNIVLLRPIKDIIEFKQIVGRGTRLFDGKAYFTIYDFVEAYKHFEDKEWDGEPLDKTNGENRKTRKVQEPSGTYNVPDLVDKQPKTKIKIRLAEGKELDIEHSINTLFYADGKPITAQEFLTNLYGTLPNFFKDEAELRQLWSIPMTRKTLLDRLEQAGFDRESLNQLKELVNANNSDLFDVLEFISFSNQPLTRQERVNQAEQKIFALLNHQQREFIEFVLSKYIEIGDEELNVDKLASLLELKYHSVTDAVEVLGDIPTIRNTFIEFQKYLYNKDTA